MQIPKQLIHPYTLFSEFALHLFSWTSWSVAQTWEVNIKGTFLVTRALLPLLLESESGEKIIVNVSSIAAHGVRSGGSSYQVSRFVYLLVADCIREDLSL